MESATQKRRVLTCFAHSKLQVFHAFCSGNYIIPKKEAETYVNRAMPLQQLTRILKCEDGGKKFFVITGANCR